MKLRELDSVVQQAELVRSVVIETVFESKGKDVSQAINQFLGSREFPLQLFRDAVLFDLEQMDEDTAELKK